MLQKIGATRCPAILDEEFTNLLNSAMLEGSGPNFRPMRSTLRTAPTMTMLSGLMELMAEENVRSKADTRRRRLL